MRQGHIAFGPYMRGLLTMLRGAAVLAAASCAEPPEFAPPDAALMGCVYEGDAYGVGAAFAAKDGCNTCECRAEGVRCTEAACSQSGKKACQRTGCSGEICAETEVASDCALKAHHACYQDAVCEWQLEGQCGFTPTPTLQACLGGHRVCTYGSEEHSFGDSFKMCDGLNTCFCNEAGVMCTLL